MMWACELPCAWSLPVRERGSKLPAHVTPERMLKVAPRAGAWIETG